MRSAEHHPGPFRDECLRRREPKTAAAARDEVNPAVQSKIHPAILPGQLRVDLGLVDTVWHDQPAAGPHRDGE